VLRSLHTFGKRSIAQQQRCDQRKIYPAGDCAGSEEHKKLLGDLLEEDLASGDISIGACRKRGFIDFLKPVTTTIRNLAHIFDLLQKSPSVIFIVSLSTVVLVSSSFPSTLSRKPCL